MNNLSNAGMRSTGDRRTKPSAKSPKAHSVRVGRADKTESNRRGYRIDYAKLKVLCRQAGLKMIDLYEPGLVPRRLISEGTLKKWRRGGRGTNESIEKIADALSDRLRWRVDWRELIQTEPAKISSNHRLAIIAFHGATVDGVGRDKADGFRATILARLSNVRGLRVVSAPSLDVATFLQPEKGDWKGIRAMGVHAVLSGTLRAHGDTARLDVELTSATTQEVLWANSYPFSETDLLRAQAAIAADVANQVGLALAAM